ncbi:bromodomain associated protein [Rutstroemia sp. NJR-2017a WRK4]|nr:bromodomain associated protein [Rutstroemia sp. NJR-2017a WRK4]
MVPMSTKRSSPTPSDEEEPSSKRRCTGRELPQTPPPEHEIAFEIKSVSLFDSNVRQLLRRSVASALDFVGFDSATEEALEAMCAEVDTYTTHLLSQVTASMLIARRSAPIPHDFEYALHRFSLPLASLEPHLQPPIAVPKLKLEQEEATQEDSKTKNIVKILGPELDGEEDKKTKSYIPKGFPAFPSKHTYKWTAKEPDRMTDPRKIREEAAKSARMGEEALRRLVKVSKAGKEKDMKKIASRDPRSKERHELWERTMRSLAGDKGVNGTDSLDDRSMVVNAEKQYFRKGAPAKRKLLNPSPPPPPILSTSADLVPLEP